MDRPSDNLRVIERPRTNWSRRQFIRTAATAAAAAPLWRTIASAEQAGRVASAETHVGSLYDSLSEAQRAIVCFPWDYQDQRHGLLRTYISNNWNITEPTIDSDFFDDQQRAIIRAVFEGIYSRDWHTRIDRQLRDDAGGYGRHQSIAIFGRPGRGRFEFVMTGRHLTVRCDGDTTPHVGFGGPIFYGHAAGGFYERPDHRGNVFWPQAVEANRVFAMLDGRQRKLALVARAPRENAIAFRGHGSPLPGIPVTELSNDQKQQVRTTLRSLLAPYRKPDRREALDILSAQGGLDVCSLAFYRSGDLGGDGVWDNWRLEGPSFVWHFRGAPHVHVYVNIADDASIATNS